MPIIDFIVNSELEWLVKTEYILIAFFIVGALTSQRNKPLKVKSANYATIAVALAAFFFRLIISSNAQQQGASGKALYDILSNDVFRIIYHALLVGFLLRRLIKTCKAEKVRKARHERILAERNG